MENLSRKRALELHKLMWFDMQKELGDNPEHEDRYDFKKKWVKKYFPNEKIENHCFLCEYALTSFGGIPDGFLFLECDKCPIQWINKSNTLGVKNSCEWGYHEGNCDWRYSPISEILALPERIANEDNKE